MASERFIGAQPEVEKLVAAYRADLLAAGMFAENPVTSVARRFLSRVGVEGWARLSLAEQCATPLKDRRVVGWLIVTGRVRPSPDYLVPGVPTSARSLPVITAVFRARFAAMPRNSVSTHRDPAAMVGDDQGRGVVRGDAGSADEGDDRRPGGNSCPRRSVGIGPTRTGSKR